MLAERPLEMERWLHKAEAGLLGDCERQKPKDFLGRDMAIDQLLRCTLCKTIILREHMLSLYHP